MADFGSAIRIDSGDRTLLEIINMLLSWQARAVKAETEVERLTVELGNVKAALADAQSDYDRCVALNKDLYETIKAKDDTITWSYNERVKVENELKKLKEERGANDDA